MSWDDDFADNVTEIAPAIRIAVAAARRLDLFALTANWRLRTERILGAFLIGLVLTYVELLPLFPSRFAATKRLHRLWERGKIKRVALVHGVECGRPRYLYSKSPIKIDNSEHSYGLSRFLIQYPGALIKINEDEYSADAFLSVGGQHFFVEYDRDTEKMSYIRSRFEKYRDAPCKVLWVCPSPERQEQLRKAAEIVKHNSLFGVESEIAADPRGKVWLGHSGNRYSIG